MRQNNVMDKNTVVLHVIGATAAGGAESFVVELCIAMASIGYKVGVFALSDRSDDVGITQRKKLQQAGINFSTGPTRKVGVPSLVAYWKFLKSFKPGLIHLHTQNTELANALVSCFYRRRSVIARTIHSTKLNLSLLYRWSYERNNRLLSVACSQAVADAQKNFGESVEVIPNGKIFSWPLKNTKNSIQYKEKLMLDANKTHFVSVGRMDGVSLDASPKAHNIMIQAWLAFNLGAKGGVLHLIGDGPLKEELIALADNDESIVFEGVKDNVTDWLIASDVYLMPSRTEGLPISGIEAVGTGLACIFSDIEPLKLLKPSVISWVSVNDIDALGLAMVSDQARSFHDVAIDVELQRIRFGMETTLSRYLSYYDKLHNVTESALTS